MINPRPISKNTIKPSASFLYFIPLMIKLTGLLVKLTLLTITFAVVDQTQAVIS